MKIMDKITWSVLKARFHAPTPAFWKAVRLKSLIIATAAGVLGPGLTGIAAKYSQYLPSWVMPTGIYITIASVLIPVLVATVASFTVEPPDKQV
jgi:hypothetical protein